MGTRHRSHRARSCELALRAVGAARGRPGGAPSALVWGVQGWRLSNARLPVLAACGRGLLPTGCQCRGRGVGTCHKPHSARSCELTLRALRAAGGHLGGAPLACVWDVRGRALSHARPPVLGVCRRGPPATGSGCGGCGRGDPSPTPQRALLQADFARCGGGRKGPGSCASCLRLGRPGSGGHPRLTARALGVRRGSATHWLRMQCAGFGPGSPSRLPRAVVCPVLCALPGFAAPGGRCCWAPFLVPWLWPAACLSGGPRGPALVRRASSGPVALGAPVSFPIAVMPSPPPGAVAPGFTGLLRGARGGRPRTGLNVPAAGPC